MKQSILIFLACLLLGGLVLAGCGSDDDSSANAGSDGASAVSEEGDAGGGEAAAPVQTSSASEDEYVAAAQEVCKQARKTIEDKAAKLLAKGEGRSQKEFMSTLVGQAIMPGLEGEAEELRELGAPEGDEEQVEAIVEAVETMASDAQEDPEAFLTRPAEFTEANELASEYGISACGKVNR